MPFLYRNINFCECGRPALPDSRECRTCYEGALRRRWRDDMHLSESGQSTLPVGATSIKMIRPRLRSSFAPDATV
jgi:hypothetical protein